ncbi:M20/M25/M40 family metallo-hydrolase [Arthrobacter antibioticus]|uniref:M20/M25/M40 family metallo-hydrolase n=1 Tax=Arthrobacter sp. H35-MC1 TaxID=3046203 RepID=UPI0024B8B86B|nr:M20/M25/M40 family metallo-hydrolase [Arthrobacter sp. H35-MC1]MDJ0316313.1 M20/M25/M40 family metallo-hydrolase [Arthrobacter sp. H35-MC1]
MRKGSARPLSHAARTGSAARTARAVAAALVVSAGGTAAVIGARAHSAGAAPPAYDQAPETGVQYAQPAADQLSELIGFRTVFASARDLIELDQFTGFIEALERLYPGVHTVLSREFVNGHALLFKWAGSKSDADAKPTVLMAHYDVVPVDTRDDWKHPGFSGHQENGWVWGRGALDDKGALVVIMGAIETLIDDGFAPAYDLYLSFGNNEESTGDSARAAADLLARRGVKPWLVLDEGGAVALDAFPGLKAPAAVIGVAEKGSLDLELLTRGAGGHASTPPRMGATARLAQAIVALEETQFPASMPAPIVEMMRRIGLHSSFALRLITENMWIFKTPLTQVFSWVGDETRALTRTTVAVTMLEGSKASNVLASTARANANIRIAVGESVDSVVEQVRTIIDDPSVELRVLSGHDPSPISSFESDQFALLTRAVAASYPAAVVTPYIQTGATDSRHLCTISPAVYRFSPLLMDASDRASLHAVNERVRIGSLGAGVVFYRELIQNLR